MIEVAFPEDSRFHREVGIKLEVAKGDIWRFQRVTIIKILDCIYAVDTTLVPDSFEDMQEIIHQFAQTATRFGLLVNMQITMSVRLIQAGEEEGTVHLLHRGPSLAGYQFLPIPWQHASPQKMIWWGSSICELDGHVVCFHSWRGGYGISEVSGRRPKPKFSMLWWHPPYCTVLEHGLERSSKLKCLRAHSIQAGMLHAGSQANGPYPNETGVRRAGHDTTEVSKSQWGLQCVRPPLMSPASLPPPTGHVTVHHNVGQPWLIIVEDPGSPC